MTTPVYIVRADWDAEAGVWFVFSDDVAGLATGAETFEELIDRLKVVVPELLEENGLLPEPGDVTDVPFFVMAQRLECAHRAA